MRGVLGLFGVIALLASGCAASAHAAEAPGPAPCAGGEWVSERVIRARYGGKMGRGPDGWEAAHWRCPPSAF